MMKKLLSEFKEKFFKFLPQQPVASVTIQNPTISPSRSLRSPCRVSILPKEAGRKLRSTPSFGVREPGSPEVTCIGQVHSCKKKRKVKKKRQQQKKAATEAVAASSSKICDKVKKEKVLLWIFRGSGDEGTKQSGKAFVLEEKEKVNDDKTPPLGAMKKFLSGRGALSDFDATVAAER